MSELALMGSTVVKASITGLREGEIPTITLICADGTSTAHAIEKDNPALEKILADAFGDTVIGANQ